METPDIAALLEGLTEEEIADLVGGLPDEAVHILAAELAAANHHALADSVTAQALRLDAKFSTRPHLDHLSEVISEAVKDVEGGKDRRIVVEMPPRTGKTTLATLTTAAWIMARNPSWPIALTSHDGGLATSWGRQIRRWAESGALGPQVKVAPDAGAVSAWETTEGGRLLSISTRESFTGRGAKCVGPDVLIESEYGKIRAEDAFARGVTRILAYDHRTGRAEFRPVVAAQRKPGGRLLEIVTQSGRRLAVTDDHKIYTGEGYVAAGSLRGGEALVAVPTASRVQVREAIQCSCHGGTQESKVRWNDLLHNTVRSEPYPARPSNEPMPLWSTDSIYAKECYLLFPRVPKNIHEHSETQTEAMSGVSFNFPTAFLPHSVLREGMRKLSSLETNDRNWELSLSGRAVLHSSVSDDAPFNFGERPWEMRSLRTVANGYVSTQERGCNTFPFGYPSHKRGCKRQRATEPNNVVLDMSHGSPQVESDTVSMVLESSEPANYVYDFQVDGTSNFFADEILVHNCLLIDDPHKDFVDAHSPTMRDNVWDWWLSVAQTRLEPPSLVIVTMTRWHEDDFVGRLLSKEYPGDPADWQVVSFPAVASHNDVLDREPGDPLFSPLLNETREQALKRWDSVKEAVGAYVWSSMYQQRPAPAKGSIFDMEKWRYWTRDPSKATDDGRVTYFDPEAAQGAAWLDSWDFSFGTGGTVSGDYVVGQRWVKVGPYRYLIAQQRGRWGFTDMTKRLQEWTAGGGPHGSKVHLRLVENKANGPAIINVLQQTVSGIKPINPRESKEARARACTPEIESGHVLLPLPSEQPWVTDFLAEIRNFPHDSHDDQVDAMTQALLELRGGGGGGIGSATARRRPTDRIGRR